MGASRDGERKYWKPRQLFLGRDILRYNDMNQNARYEYIIRSNSDLHTQAGVVSSNLRVISSPLPHFVVSIPRFPLLIGKSRLPCPLDPQ